MLMCMTLSRGGRLRQSQIYSEFTTIQLTMTKNTVYHNSYANVYEIYKMREALVVSNPLNVLCNTVYHDKAYSLA